MSQQQPQQQANEEQVLDGNVTFDENYYNEINTWWFDNAYEIEFRKKPEIYSKRQVSKPLSVVSNGCVFEYNFIQECYKEQYRDFLYQLKNSTFPIVRIKLIGHAGGYGHVENVSISEEIIQDICKNLPKTCVAVVFENTTCRFRHQIQYEIPKELEPIRDRNGSIEGQTPNGWVNLDDAVTNAFQKHSKVNWLILGQVNKGDIGKADVRHLRLFCRNNTEFKQKDEKNVGKVYKERKSEAKKNQGFKVPDRSEINQEQYKLWLGHLIPRKLDKDTEYTDYHYGDLTEELLKRRSLGQEKYDDIITKVIEGNFTITDELIHDHKFNIFDFRTALKENKKNGRNRPEICRQGWWAKALSFGANNARVRRINQLAKILERAYTKNMTMEEKREAKQKWKTNKSSREDQYITWLDL